MQPCWSHTIATAVAANSEGSSVATAACCTISDASLDTRWCQQVSELLVIDLQKLSSDSKLPVAAGLLNDIKQLPASADDRQVSAAVDSSCSGHVVHKLLLSLLRFCTVACSLT